MAEDLDDGEFWLPSQFLTDEEDDHHHHHHLLMNRIHNIQFGSYGVSGSPPLLLSKRPTSPVVESATMMMRSSTTLTEERENHLTGRPTCQIPHSKLKERVIMSGGSPKSPLCDIGNWSAFSCCSSSGGRGGGGGSSSSRGSPICSSLVSSSPSSSSTPPLNVKQEDPLDLLKAAAGQIGRLKLNDEEHRHKIGPPPLLEEITTTTTTPVSSSSKVKNNHLPTKKLGLFSNQALIQQQLQDAHQFQQRKQQQQQLLRQQLSAPWGQQGKVVVVPPARPPQQQQQLLRQQLSAPWGQQGKVVVVPPARPPQQQQQQVQSSSRRCARPFGMASSSSTRQPLHQQQGSATSRESCGTGVFIPIRRSIIPAAETLKKPAGCPAVLVPAKVVQAPNLSYNAMGGDTGVLTSNEHVKCSSSIQQTRTASDAVISSGPQHHPQNVASHEICLPKEWTY